MNKRDFTEDLRSRLSGIPKQEAEERIGFYSEIIDDKTEEGLTEEEAVAEIGSAEKIAEQVLSELSAQKGVKKNAKPKRRIKTWEIVLIALGSPIWLSLAIAAFAVVISLYAVLWSVIISIWAVFASVIACAPACAVVSMICISQGNSLVGIAMIGAGVFCIGLSVFIFFGCVQATRGVITLTKKIAIWIKNRFVKKEKA